MLDFSSPDSKNEQMSVPDTLKCQILLIAQSNFSVDGMVSLLENYSDRFEVTVKNPSDFTLESLASNCPDVILLNTKAYDSPIDTFIREVHQCNPVINILLFGYQMDEQYLYKALRSGAKGYLNENMRGDHLTTALNTVFSGGYWAERHIINRFVSDKSIHDKIEDKVVLLKDRLTRRENEVLVLILEGMPTNDIADKICLSHQGVKAHLTNLFRKFGVKNRAQLIIAALNEVSPINNITHVIQNSLRGDISSNNSLLKAVS